MGDFKEKYRFFKFKKTDRTWVAFSNGNNLQELSSRPIKQILPSSGTLRPYYSLFFIPTY